MTLWTFSAPLAFIGLVHGGLKNAWECCVMGNAFTNAWWLHAPVPLLLVLPQKSNVSPDLSASEGQAPVGGPLVYPVLLCYKIMTLIDKIVHYTFLVLIGSVF